MSDPVTTTLTIGTRGSQLALTQSELIRSALLAYHPHLTVKLLPISTRGDQILDRPLAAIGGKGLFVAEIEAALRAGRADLAVHSAKDLPAELPADLWLRFCLPRADARDVLITPSGSLAHLPAGARVGTSSPRRCCQLLARRPDLAPVSIRGNVDTRLRKLAAGEYDALVLAAAGLERLHLGEQISEWLSPTVMLPAAGQGVLAVQLRAGDERLAEWLAPLIDPATNAAVTAERAFVAAAGGSCNAAVAAHAVVAADRLTLTGLIGAPDGRLVRAELAGLVDDASALGTTLAEILLARGGAALLAAGVAG